MADDIRTIKSNAKLWQGIFCLFTCFIACLAVDKGSKRKESLWQSIMSSKWNVQG